MLKHKSDIRLIPLLHTVSIPFSVFCLIYFFSLFLFFWGTNNYCTVCSERFLKKCRIETKLTIWCVCGVVDTRSKGTSGVSSSTEPVMLIWSYVAPGAHVDLKVTVFRKRTLSVRQQHIIKSHVSLLWGTSLHTFNYDLECKACHDRRWRVALSLFLTQEHHSTYSVTTSILAEIYIHGFSKFV